MKDKMYSKIILLIIIIAVLGTYIYYLLNNIHGLGWYHFIPLFFIIFIVLIILSLLYFRKDNITYNDYLKEIVNTKEKRRFKYIDSFYYNKVVKNEDINKMLIVYHVIEDMENNNYYAIESYYSNSFFRGPIDNIKLFKGANWFNNPNIIKYGDTGSFWIDKELNNYYKCVDNNMIINDYSIENPNDIKSYTQTFTNSLFDKITFITGYVEFDIDK